MPKIGMKRILFYVLTILLIVVLSVLIWFKYSTQLEEPNPTDKSALELKRTKVADNFYRCGNSWFKKSESGLWELFVEGKPFERGVKIGILSKELIEYQEAAFLNQIEKIIPSRSFLYFLKYFIQFFDRNIDKHITKEFLEEIYGISQFASDNYNFIGSNYGRILNYHAAHDIGHALQNMKMVGCTSFSAWGDKTENGDLIVGRNFDFYVGDDFAKNKIVCFMKPDKGYKFAFITWAGMIGVVSGMNEKGVTVTINAAKSEIPGGAKTPISILVREILQYSANIKDAIEIVKKRNVFVSESILLASAEDKRSVVIEVQPSKCSGNNCTAEFGVFDIAENYMICTNHFQSNIFKNSESNKQQIAESASLYRFNRVSELLKPAFPLNYLKASQILRDRYGLSGMDIGLGNEKAVNQLISHHSVIFEPEKRLIWVSTAPYQLGKYVCYDLNKVFGKYANLTSKQEIYEPQYQIEPDSLLKTQQWSNYLNSKQTKQKLSEDNFKLSENEEVNFIGSNPEFFETYSALGNYYSKRKNCFKANDYYQKALTKNIPTVNETKTIAEKIKDCHAK